MTSKDYDFVNKVLEMYSCYLISFYRKNGIP